MKSTHFCCSKRALVLWPSVLGSALWLLSPPLTFGHQLTSLCGPSIRGGPLKWTKGSRSVDLSAESKELIEELNEEDEEDEEIESFVDAQWSEAPESWPAELAKLFVDLGPHDAATEFILNAPMASSPQALMYQALCELPLNEFDLQALLYPAGSHLLTTEQLQMLLARTGKTEPEVRELRVLDVGAGDGCITKNLRALGLSRLVASETSIGMAMRLWMGGYEVWREDTCMVSSFELAHPFCCPLFSDGLKPTKKFPKPSYFSGCWWVFGMKGHSIYSNRKSEQGRVLFIGLYAECS